MNAKVFSHLLRWTYHEHGMLEIKNDNCHDCPFCKNEMMFNHWHDYSTNDETFTCSFCGFSFHEHRKWHRDGTVRDSGSFYLLIKLNRPAIKNFKRAKSFFSKFKSRFTELKFDNGSIFILKSKINITYFFAVNSNSIHDLTEDNYVLVSFLQWVYFDFDTKIATFVFDIENEEYEELIPFKEAYEILTALGIYNEQFSSLERLTKNEIKQISTENCKIGLAKLKENEAKAIKYNYTDWWLLKLSHSLWAI